MAHDGRHFIAAPIKSRPAIGTVGNGTGLPQLDISRCMPPTAPRATAEVPRMAAETLRTTTEALRTTTEVPRMETEAPPAQGELTVHVDRTQVIGAGQYSTVCLGMIATADAPDKRIKCAIKIPHANDLDARELGLVEAAGLWQAGSAPQTVGCFGLVNLKTIGGAQGECRVELWPAVAAQAIAGDGEWALVLEYCERGPCWSWMLENRMSMDAELFFVWARQLATALVALKAAGMAHMDIKGHNVLLTSDGHVRLADFTAAKFSAHALEAMQLASPGFDPRSYPAYTDFSGTIPYCAPEALAPGASSKQHSNDEQHKMDIYALGVTLYALFVSGRSPYATVKSAVEQMLLASKGAFWEWEERHSIATLQSAAETAPSTPIESMQPANMLNATMPPSPVEPVCLLSRSVSLGPKPLVRRRTLKSRKAAPREFRRFLSGDLLPVNIEALLHDMVDPDPSKRPDAADILRVLDSVESEIFEP
ncbi:hypothetical protein IWW50_003897 [Coemansia erecta]|nr:hypothetical protein GGF43_003475 [Coemansia sp. RSA 2618]KAJ2823172.1 hypothetical protein IWW50_003897 [Coemansia erecta]